MKEHKGRLSLQADGIPVRTGNGWATYYPETQEELDEWRRHPIITDAARMAGIQVITTMEEVNRILARMD